MTVSVIVPAHNYGRYLEQVVDSLRRQVYADWECVVVDDGSSDGTAQIVAAMAASDHRISYMVQPASGPSAARNAGLAAGSGEFVQFLDADDFLGSRKLRHQLDVFARQPEADIVYGGVRYFREGDPESAGEAERSWTGGSAPQAVSGRGEAILEPLVDENFMVVEAPLVRRSLLDRAGGFDPRIRRMEDWELWLRCALAGAYFVYDGAQDDDALPHVRIHRTSSSQDQIAMHRAAVEVRQAVESRLPTTALRRLNGKRIHGHLAIIGMLEGLGGRLGYGMRCLLRAGVSERRATWLAWGVLMPLARVPPGRLAIGRLRSFRAGRRGEEVREWQARWP
jgi:glycosyltransferase involved in cell wall biosynthesis